MSGRLTEVFGAPFQVHGIQSDCRLAARRFAAAGSYVAHRATRKANVFCNVCQRKTG
jgi:hypothetical protein